MKQILCTIHIACVFLACTICRADDKPIALQTISLSKDKSAVGLANWMGFSPTGDYLGVLYGQQENLRLAIFNANTGAKQASTIISDKMSHLYSNATFTPDGKWVAYEDGAKLKFLSVNEGQKRATYTTVKNNIVLPNLANSSFAYGNGESPIYWANAQGLHYAVYSWKYELEMVSRPMLQSDYPGHARVRLLAPAVGRFAIALSMESEDKSEMVLHSWSLEKTPSKTVFPLSVPAWSLAFSSDGKQLAAGCADGSVALFDLVKGEAVSDILPLGTSITGSLAFHPSGKYLVYGTFDNKGRPNLFVADLVKGKVVVRMIESMNGVTAVCFNSVGDRLAVAGGNDIKIWDFATLLKNEGQWDVEALVVPKTK